MSNSGSAGGQSETAPETAATHQPSNHGQPSLEKRPLNGARPPAESPARVVEDSKEVAHLANRTARRIAILPRRGENNAEEEPLILPPFTTRLVDAEVLKQFAYQEWLNYNLIELAIERPAEETARKSSNTDYSGAFGVAFVGLVMYAAFAYTLVKDALPSASDPLVWAIVIAIPVLVAIIAATIIFRDVRIGFTAAVTWVFGVLNAVLVFCIGLGVPLLTAWFLGKVPPADVGTRSLELSAIGSLLQLVVIAIASVLPALLYFIFSRQQFESIREGFLREVMLLDPNVFTLEEATSKYDSLIRQLYGSNERSGLFNAGLPILISTVMMSVGWTVTLLTTSTGPSQQRLESYLAPTITPLTLGFLGAYFFALNLVFRRYVRADLTPKAYSHITMRLFITMILVWVVGTLPFFQPDTNGEANALLLVLAFIIGIVPETGMALIQEFLRKGLVRIRINSLDEQHPLTNLEGMNLYDRARLLEEGIENVENLAHYNLIELMLRTRIPTARLVDMFDQAALYLRLGGDAKSVAEVRDALRGFGIRTATDLEYAAVADEDLETRAGGDKKRPALSTELGERRGRLACVIDGLAANAQVKDGPPRLPIILETLRSSEWMTYLRHWRRLRSENEPVRSPESFYGEQSVRVSLRATLPDRSLPPFALADGT
jgi:hypothetical protein